MDGAKAEAWRRFYDQVISDPDWPRELWFAAVEDALAAALPEPSRLLADYRDDVAELLHLERMASGAYQDEKRIAQLEAQIRRLIGLADDTIGAASGAAPAAVTGTVEQRAGAPEVAPRSPGGWHAGRATLGALALATITFGAGVVGTAYHYDNRLNARLDAALDGWRGTLEARVEALRTDLDARFAEADHLNQRLTAMQAELRANMDDFGTTVAQAVDSVVALGDSAVTKLERRLSADGAELPRLIGRLRARAGALDRGLDEVSAELAKAERRLPGVSDGLGTLERGLKVTEADFRGVADEVDALKTEAPKLSVWLAGQRQELTQGVDEERAALEGLHAEISALQGEIEQSQGRVEGFKRSLDESLRRARRDGATLQAAIEDVRAGGLLATRSMAAVETQITGAQQALDREIERVLGEIASRADRAMGRDAGETKRALAESREAELARLLEQAEASRTELERTGGAIVASWRRMDETVAERQAEVLRGLDGYASTIERRMQELLRALDVTVAQRSE